MTKYFDGKKIREEILSEIENEIKKMDRKPCLAVISVGEDLVSSKYVELKKKVADRVGVRFKNYYYDINNTQQEIIEKIHELNEDECVDGIMVQMPIPDKFDKFEVVHAISPEKDVDGLRFCCSYKSAFKPPVVLAILKAIEEAGKNLSDEKVVIVGRGFLVGWPLAQCLEEEVAGLIVADNSTINLPEITKTADILISAVGKHDIITPEMVKEGVVLIDAGTTEVSGEIRGDIDPACYEKASYYTPVPGGIGPVTVAMLLKNLVR